MSRIVWSIMLFPVQTVTGIIGRALDTLGTARLDTLVVPFLVLRTVDGIYSEYRGKGYRSQLVGSRCPESHVDGFYRTCTALGSDRNGWIDAVTAHIHNPSPCSE